jgi:hypothetical protein
MLLVGEERSDRREDPRSDPESACENLTVNRRKAPKSLPPSPGRHGFLHAHAPPPHFTQRRGFMPFHTATGFHLQRVEHGQAALPSTQVPYSRVAGAPRMPLQKGSPGSWARFRLGKFQRRAGWNHGERWPSAARCRNRPKGADPSVQHAKSRLRDWRPLLHVGIRNQEAIILLLHILLIGLDLKRLELHCDHRGWRGGGHDPAAPSLRRETGFWRVRRDPGGPSLL